MIQLAILGQASAEGIPVDQYALEGLDKNWGDPSDPNLSQALYYIRNGEFELHKSSVEIKTGRPILSKGYPLNRSYLIMNPIKN